MSRRFLPLLLLLPALCGQTPDAPAPLEMAASRIRLPEGFHATLFAGEPDIVQPIAMTTDDRGRLWVVECLSYPNWETEGKSGADRVVILEDTDGNGHLDSRTVFWDKGANLTGIALGFGGVWLTATPEIIFIADRDGDDKPDGKPEVLLDGWDLKARHNVVNGLTWGPDGWLYGCNGILSNSLVGKPGTPPEMRTPLNCGVWRYHPTRNTFEVVASGTTNPWGLDFDDHGEMFITNCVIKHLFHVIPGAHYTRMFGNDINPNSYGLIESCADHIHWGGGPWQESRGGVGKHDGPGGGHAHAGCMIYLGDNWPAEFRNNLFTCNIHGNRVNRDLLARHGSGYVASHGKDFLFANDLWFRGLELHCGPDGGVYVSDWSDTGECHDYEDIHRENGRIYKVTYGTPTVTPVHVADASNAELVELQLHQNDWHVRQARRILQERAAADGTDPDVTKALVTMFEKQPQVTRKLRALWALHVTGALSAELLDQALSSPDEAVRAWGIRLALESGNPKESLLTQLTKLAREDESAQVRLALASGLQRIPAANRWHIAEALLGHAEDAEDPNLPLMIWYGIEPLVETNKTQFVGLVAKTKIPLIRQFIARRLASQAM